MRAPLLHLDLHSTYPIPASSTHTASAALTPHLPTESASSTHTARSTSTSCSSYLEYHDNIEKIRSQPSRRLTVTVTDSELSTQTEAKQEKNPNTNAGRGSLGCNAMRLASKLYVGSQTAILKELAARVLKHRHHLRPGMS
jgi:hypothetical protein